MRRPGGYALLVDPTNNTHRECDTFTCSHCQRVIAVKAKQDPSEMGGFCRMCDKNICPHCVTSGRCDPFEKKLERMERRDRLLRQ